MASWIDISTATPDFAAAVERSFAHGKHKVMATLRADGSPRVSGTEVDFRWGEFWLGSMPGARKAHDLQRDPRVAVHGPTIDESMSVGDAKLSGRAIEITDPAEFARYRADLADAKDGEVPDGPFHLFRLDITEAVRTWVEDAALMVESWHPDSGYVRIERRD